MKLSPSQILLVPILVTPLFAAACSSTDESAALKTFEEARWDQLFKLVDADGDGKVTREEFARNYLWVTWGYMDRNGDGYITMDEWALDGRSPERDAWFRDLDTNGDGRISHEEFQAAASPEGVERFFALMDKTGDGVITRKDLQKR